MTPNSGAGYARTNGSSQLSFIPSAEASSGPPSEDSFSDDIRFADEAKTACGGSRQERKEAAYRRYRDLMLELASSYKTTNWDKRRTTFASLVALQASSCLEGTELVRECITESKHKDVPLSWFCFTVLTRLKEYGLWDRNICYWFNKRKQRFDSLESFQSMFDH